MFYASGVTHQYEALSFGAPHANFVENLATAWNS